MSDAGPIELGGNEKSGAGTCFGCALPVWGSGIYMMTAGGKYVLYALPFVLLPLLGALVMWLTHALGSFTRVDGRRVLSVSRWGAKETLLWEIPEGAALVVEHSVDRSTQNRVSSPSERSAGAEYITHAQVTKNVYTLRVEPPGKVLVESGSLVGALGLAEQLSERFPDLQCVDRATPQS